MENPSGSSLRRLQVGNPHQTPHMYCVQSHCAILHCGSSPTEPAAEHHGSSTTSVPRPWSFPVQFWSDSLQETHLHSRYGGHSANLLTWASASYELTPPLMSHFPFLVGKPIAVVQTPSPSSDDIDSLHRVYLQNLTELFEEHKQNYGLNPEEHLTFI